MAQAERTRVYILKFVLFIQVYCCCGEISLAGFRVEAKENFAFDTEQMMYILNSETDLVLRLYGSEFTSNASVSFTTDNKSNICNLLITPAFQIIEEDADGTSAIVRINLPKVAEPMDYMFCIKADPGDQSSWLHQGNQYWVKFRTSPKPSRSTLLPLWLQIMVIGILLIASGLFSGLNLGLMSLDKTELKILLNSGTPREKSYAKKVGTVRKHGNYLLCTILLGNVLVNNTLAILMDDMTGSGAIAIIVSTAGIVMFGEIIPQAICSRYGLAIGAKTIWFTRFFMLITFPLSFPISKILDCILGEEMGSVYNRERLRELLQVTQENMDLVKDEMNIIAGALELSKKTVKHIMTAIDDVYMINQNAVLDFETMSEIMKTGYTRVPVYEKDKKNIVALLNIKDLAFVDPDDRTPLTTVCKFYNHPINFVFEDTKLDAMLSEFKKGQCHMSFVRSVNSEGPGDPFYVTQGLVTLEDVIEEIIQSEIMDETDTITDNRSKMQRANQMKDFSVFNKPTESHGLNHPMMSPQLALATFQYLSTAVTPFRPEYISEHVLQRLIKQNVLFTVRVTDHPEKCVLYQRNKPCDYFILILQGKVEVDVGKESMVFEGGPFMSFGIQALTGPLSKPQSITSLSSASDSAYTSSQKYIPDFSVKAVVETQYLQIRRSHYMAARRATAMEKTQKASAGTPHMDEAFNKEWQRAISHDPDRESVKVNIEESESLATPRDVGSLKSPSIDGDINKRLSTGDKDSNPGDKDSLNVEVASNASSVTVGNMTSPSSVQLADKQTTGNHEIPNSPEVKT